VQSKKEILKQAMSKKYCGETYFDFLDKEEKPLIYKAMEEYAKQREIYKNGWIDANEKQPLLVENEDYSPNVLAICNGQLMVMCYCYNPSEDDSERGFFWANCNGQIDGDAEFDDEYDVTFWQYLPSIVGFVA
jgi:hypothetical protein